MMNNRRRTWLLLVALLGVTLAVYFEPTHCVRGCLWGEAFFDGRPTSYWRGIVESDLGSEWHLFGQMQGLPVATRPRSGWTGRCMDWLGFQPEHARSLDLIKEEAGIAVLRELQQDTDPTIAGFARDALDPDADLVAVGMGMGMRSFDDKKFNRWLDLHFKYGSRPE